jgi:hypothetical protein
MSRRRLPLAGLSALLGALALMMLGGAPAASALAPATPHWHLEVRPAPTNLPLTGKAELVVTAANLGDAPTAGEKAKPIVLKDTLPAGIEATGTREPGIDFGGTPRYSITNPPGFACTVAASVVECTFPHPLQPYEQIQFLIEVNMNFSSAAKPQNELQVAENGVTAAQSIKELNVNGEPTSYAIEPGSFEMVPEDEEFKTETAAGSHPFQLTTTVNFTQTARANGPGKPVLPTVSDLSKNLNFALPPGLLGNPTAMPQCSDSQFGVHEENNLNACPENTVIGVADVEYNNASTPNLEFASQAVPIFNLEPGAGEPARFGFELFHVPIILNTEVRTGGDYGANIKVENTSDTVQVLATRVTIWGTPNDPRHDSVRGWPCLGEGAYVSGIKPKPPVCGAHAVHNEKAFLVMPTSCGTQATIAEGEAWDGAKLPQATSSFELTGCEELAFEPNLEVKTDKHSASTPTGLGVELNLPQEGTLTENGRAEADIKSFTLELPEGLTTSSGAANNLLACGVSEAGFAGLDSDTGETLGAELLAQHFSFLPPPKRELGLESKCPQAAKLGNVEINTPFLKNPVTGGVFLARQDTNPFAPRLVLYIIAEEPESKVLIKLAGEVEITPAGRLISRFRNSPQAAFEHLKLHLFNGSSSGAETAAQATPSRCSTTAYSATGKFGTWSEAPGEPEPTSEVTTNPEGMAITSGPGGTPCVEPGQPLPFGPSFQAGASNPEAGKFSPFTVTIARPDGNQALNTIAVTLPPGAAAKIASVEQCPEPAAALGTCGPASLIGHSETYSGLGNSPFALPGSVYLTGPYNGAPFGLSVVTPAESVGPFNIGKIVVRSSISIDQNTAQATINTAATRVYDSDGNVEDYAGVPEMLKGLPSQVKRIDVTVDRPEFEFNPTDCEPMSVNGTLTGHEGASASVSSPFKVTNCGALPFAPKLTASVSGQGSRVNGVTFNVKLESPGFGQANIHKVFLTIPKALPSRLTTIQKACDDKIFNANPAGCPEGSNIGFATIHTPVLKSALSGPAYLVSHANAAFPDVIFVLQGEGIKLVLDGKTDIKNGVTYSRFETAPDAPFTTFETVLPAGPHSALGAFVPESENYSLCKQEISLPTEITAQSGTVLTKSTPVSKIGCSGVLGKKVKKLTRAQKLAKALKACHKLKKKSKRQACEKAARKKYGPKKPAKKKKK